MENEIGSRAHLVRSLHFYWFSNINLSYSWFDFYSHLQN